MIINERNNRRKARIDTGHISIKGDEKWNCLKTVM